MSRTTANLAIRASAPHLLEMTQSVLFTDSARNVLALARHEAVALQNEFVGTEHLLLGMLASGDASVASVLKEIKIDTVTLRTQLLAVVKRGNASKNADDLPFTGRTQQVFDAAMTEARERGDREVSTGHLLVGIVREQQNIAAQLLLQFGADLAHVRAAFHGRVTE